MSIFETIYGGFSNFPYLFRTDYPPKIKIKLLLTWFKINLKYLTLNKLFSLKNENLFGFKVSAFDYETILFLFQEIFYRNEYFFKSNQNEPVIFDCGANIGFATLFFKWMYPLSEIYAFEPDIDTFKVLKKNVEQNKLENVHLFNSALSDKNGKIDFFIDSERPGSLVMSTMYDRLPKNKITIDAMSLSSFIKEKNFDSIEFVKMDIEGSEKEVISELNKNNQIGLISKLCIEYHHKIDNHKSDLSEFLRIFEKNGFEYQIDTKNIPISAENRFQDVLLYLYR
ncbi:MAG: FkbM family methyltransferase [Methanobacteriaceae archaeon]|nr:FkbM family methyltransferase [Methanobacteriaceae archaeon]